EEYSLVTAIVPRTTAATCASMMPHVTKEPTDSSDSGLASQSADIQVTRPVNPAPTTTSATSVHIVERSDQNLIHSARVVVANVTFSCVVGSGGLDGGAA